MTETNMDFENEFEKVLASQDVQSDVAPTVQEPTWTRIKDFKIYSVEGGTTLYANGRQQSTNTGVHSRQ